MSWFKLDDQGAFHEKVLDAGNEAYGAWCRAGQWSSGRGTEGHLPRSTALTIAPLKIWLRLIAAKGRSDVGLIEADGDDFQIHDYLDWNPTAEAVDAKREARSEAGRRGGLQSGVRRRSKQTPKQPGSKPEAIASANVKQKETPSPSPSPSPSQSQGAVSAAEPSRPTLTRFEEPFWRASYAEVVTATLGAPWGFPDKQLSGLRRAIKTHCNRMADIDGWLRETVLAFVQATRSKPEIWSSFGPDGLLRWLNARSAGGERLPGQPIPAKKQPTPPYLQPYVDPYETTPKPTGPR